MGKERGLLLKLLKLADTPRDIMLAGKERIGNNFEEMKLLAGLAFIATTVFFFTTAESITRRVKAKTIKIS